jgi:uncharacterized protein (DUF2249 family)
MDHFKRSLPMLTSHSGLSAPRTFELDIRKMPHSTRRSVVFARLDDMGLEDRMIVICEHEPEGLRSQIAAWWPDEFDWFCRETDAAEWRAEITRRQ